MASCKAQEMHIAMLKITSSSCKVQERHIASSKLPWVLAKLKKNAHCKFEITWGSCKAQEMHIACLKLRQALAKLKKFMFDAHMGPTQDQSSLNAVYGTKTSLGPPIDWCVKFSCWLWAFWPVCQQATGFQCAGRWTLWITLLNYHISHLCASQQSFLNSKTATADIENGQTGPAPTSTHCRMDGLWTGNTFLVP